MFTQTFVYTNTDSDPAIEELRTFAAADTTDTSASGYANSNAIIAAYSQFMASVTGYVDLVAGETTPHRVTFMKVWETEADRDSVNAQLRANTGLYNAYSALLTRYRTAYNLTTDPAPGQPPHYFP